MTDPLTGPDRPIAPVPPPGTEHPYPPRMVVKHGGSLSISLPPGWCKRVDLQPGDFIVCAVTPQESNLVIAKWGPGPHRTPRRNDPDRID